MLNQVVIFSYLDYHKGVWFDWKVGDEDTRKLIPLQNIKEKHPSSTKGNGKTQAKDGNKKRYLALQWWT
jgi:hypothetical protein